MMCPSLSQQWLSVSNSILNFLHSLTNKLQIRADIPTDPQHFFPALPGQSDSQLLPPVQSLSIGIFPAYILSDLYNMGIRRQLDVISTNLLKHAVKAFRDTIWKPRCILNAKKEKRLGISLADKRFCALSSSATPRLNADQNSSNYYQTLLERWKLNWVMGHEEMT